MVYINDNHDKTCFVLIHNESKFFDNLCDWLRPTCNLLERASTGYNRDDDSEISWFSLGENERYWLNYLVDDHYSSGTNDIEISGFDVAANHSEMCFYNVEYHYWDNEGNEITDKELFSEASSNSLTITF